MRYSHRFFLYAPVAAVVALAAAACAYWFVTAHAFAERLEALNGHQVAPGVTLHYASKSIGGFPFRVDAELEKLRLDVATVQGPASWTSEHFALHMLDYGQRHMLFEAAGRQTLSWHDEKGSEENIAFTPALLRASTIARDGRLSRFDLELFGASTSLFKTDHSELHMRQDPDRDALDIVFMADDVHLSAALHTALGDLISKIRLKGTLAPADEWNTLLAGHSDWRSAAEKWRTHSGTFHLAQLDVTWGKATAHGTGRLALDRAHRPEGLVKFDLASVSAPPDNEAANKNILTAILAQAARMADTPSGERPITLAFKGGLAYVDDTPVGFAAPVY